MDLTVAFDKNIENSQSESHLKAFALGPANITQITIIYIVEVDKNSSNLKLITVTPKRRLAQLLYLRSK